MMFGSRESFRYRECGGCGCLALLDVPDDLSRHYPPGYYSFHDHGRPASGGVARALRRIRSEIALRLPPSWVDRLVATGVVPGLFQWTAGLGLTTGSGVADIGSGSGYILHFFARNGFTNLVGFDPYLGDDRTIEGGIRLRRAELEAIPGRYGLVMVHHAFEHMPDPARTLRALSALIAPGGALVIRTPVADCWAWRHFGVDWVQLDAPRHLFIHTTRSLERLALAGGLQVRKSFRDSSGFQFWGSELYRRDLPLREYESRLVEVFGSERLREFERRAKELNAAGTGDSACLVLTRR